MDAFGHAFPAGAIQEIRAHVTWTSRWSPVVDQAPSIQRRRRGHEQQDQVHQPSLIRVPNGAELHCSDLSLLRKVAAPSRTLITLLGQEPFVLGATFVSASFLAWRKEATAKEALLKLREE